MVQILLVLKVLFTQDSEVENLFCGTSPSSERSLFFSNNLFSLGFEPVQNDFQHDFICMTDETDDSVVVVELWIVLVRECNNQRLSPWGRPFSCFPDLVTDLYQNIHHGLLACLNKFCWYIINFCRLSFFCAATAISTSSRRISCRFSIGC